MSLNCLFLLLLTTNTILHARAFVALQKSWIPSFNRRYGVDNDSTSFGQGDTNSVEQELDWFKSLKARQEELQLGIGKRFRVRTQRGFLNVHSSFEDGPYAVENVVDQLEDGDIVTSTGPRVNDWIPHDAGGWSIAVHGGFVWLEPLEE